MLKQTIEIVKQMITLTISLGLTEDKEILKGDEEKSQSKLHSHSSPKHHLFLRDVRALYIEKKRYCVCMCVCVCANKEKVLVEKENINMCRF